MKREREGGREREGEKKREREGGRERGRREDLTHSCCSRTKLLVPTATIWQWFPRQQEMVGLRAGGEE